MRWSSLFVLLVIIVGCQRQQPQDSARSESKYVIEATQVMDILLHDSLTVLDLRKPEAYQKQHINSAVNVWRSEIQSDSFPYDGMMITEEGLEALFSQKGIRSGQFLVLYDDKGGCEAARLWWILRYYGYDKVAILNGGLRQWQQDGGQLSTGIKERNREDFEIEGIPNRASVITIQELGELNDNVVLIDTRSVEEFNGTIKKAGATESGHIPGSLHLDWAEAIDWDSDRLKSTEELAAIYASHIESKDTRVVTYCHSGVRSAHTYFVLTELLGFKNVQNFDGSWVQWTHEGMPTGLDKSSI